MKIVLSLISLILFLWIIQIRSSEIPYLNRHISESQSKFAEKEKELYLARDENSSLKSNVSSLKLEIAVLQREKTEFSNQLKELERTIDREREVKRTSLAKVEAEKQNQITRQEEIETKIAELEEQRDAKLSDFDERIAKISTEIGRGNRAMEAAQDEKKNPPFKEKVRGQSSIRTSDADRRIWHSRQDSIIEGFKKELIKLGKERVGVQNERDAFRDVIEGELATLVKELNELK